jgi:phosphinothricin acetyltransferase
MPPTIDGALAVRAMTDADAGAVLAIYQAGIDTGDATFETAAPDWAAFTAGRLPEHRLVAVTVSARTERAPASGGPQPRTDDVTVSARTERAPASGGPQPRTDDVTVSARTERAPASGGPQPRTDDVTVSARTERAPASGGPQPRTKDVTADTGRVLGWAALAPVSARAVYAGVAENAVYVDPGAHGRGVGEALLRALLDSADRGGIWTVQAGIFPENTASLALHRKVGFRVVGRRERIGRHHGRWRDVVLLERRSPVVN